MKTLTKLLTLGAILAVTAGSALPALAGAEFVFRGYARCVAGTPDQVGATMEVHGILEPVTGLTTPIEVDTELYEYTLAITGLDVETVDGPSGPLLRLYHDAAELSIYAKLRAGGTAADFADPATFTDGELILGGGVQAGCVASLLDFDGNGGYAGSADGAVDFTTGTQLDALEAAGFHLTSWNLNGTLADPDAGTVPVPVPDGYCRVFDVKLTPPNDPSPVEAASWGRIKSLYE